MNLLLSVAKFIFGNLINSRAILMDAWNGFSDMVSSVLSILSAAYASKRVDREHPLGFGRLEYVTSMFSTVFIVFMGLRGIYGAITDIIVMSHKDDVEIVRELLEETGQKKGEVIRKANLSRTYGYQLMEGRRRGKRDYYLLIALAMSLDLKSTQRMLSVTQCGPLHPLIKRDAAVIFAINHGYDIIRTYSFMCSLGIPPLDDGSENE